MSARCIGEPVSWLRLERFHAGELAGDERERVAAHVAACPACAACLATIREDDARPLAPLALPQVAGRARSKVVGRIVRAAGAIGALAAAAAVVLAVRAGGPMIRGDHAGGARVKGGAVAFSLVREDGERVDGESGVFRDGDRFMVLVTCPPEADVAFELAVYDEAGTSFPLPSAPSAPSAARASRFACGNDVPLGALRLTGHAGETLCLQWSEDGAPGRICKRMDPASDP
jgi:hypothetical protein